METTEKILKKIILVIDDDPSLLKLYENMFKMAGVDPMIARDGEEGLRLIKKVNPDCVILDILMPKINGVEVLKEMNNDEALKKIPVLVLTNYANYREKIKDFPIIDYLIKTSVTPNEVVSRVLNIFGMSGK